LGTILSHPVYQTGQFLFDFCANKSAQQRDNLRRVFNHQIPPASAQQRKYEEIVSKKVKLNLMRT